MCTKTERVYRRLTGIDPTEMEPRPSDIELSRWIVDYRAGKDPSKRFNFLVNGSDIPHLSIPEWVDAAAQIGDWDGQVKDLHDQGCLQ